MQIESSANGAVWGVNRYHHIWYRAGISKSKPTGTHWIKVPGSLMDVTIGCSGLYIASTSMTIFSDLPVSVQFLG